MFIGVPIVAILVAVTLVIIPLAFTIVALYVLGIFLGWPAVALAVGAQLARLIRPEQPLPVLGQLALGLIVLHLLTHVPFIGALVVLCGIIAGLGLVTQALRRWRRPPMDQPRSEPLLAVGA